MRAVPRNLLIAKGWAFGRNHLIISEKKWNHVISVIPPLFYYKALVIKLLVQYNSNISFYIIYILKFPKSPNKFHSVLKFYSNQNQAV